MSFVEFETVTAAQTVAEIAVDAGLPERAIEAARAGKADWVLGQNLDQVADSLGQDRRRLRAAYARRKAAVCGRKPGSSVPFGGLKVRALS